MNMRSVYLHQMIQTKLYEARGVIQINGVLFEHTADDSYISAVLLDVINNEVVDYGLMTREAMRLWLKAPIQLAYQMALMPIGEIIQYDNVLIKRCSEFTYSGTELAPTGGQAE